MNSWINKDINERRNICDSLIRTYKDRIPVICQPGNKQTPSIDKKKFLVPSDMTLGDFVCHIKRRLPHQFQHNMLVIFINNVYLKVSTTFEEAYYMYPSEDGMLYMKFYIENTFG